MYFYVILVRALLAEPQIEIVSTGFGKLFDLAISAEGNIALTHTSESNARIIVGENYSVITELDKKYTRVTITRDNEWVFLGSDGEANTVYFYTVNGTFIRSLVVNIGDNQYGLANRGLSTLLNGDLAVCELSTDIVYSVDPITGNSTAISQPGEFSNPIYITVNNLGNIVVGDRSGFIKCIDMEGNVLFSYGSSGTGDGQLKVPMSVATDAYDYIVIVDSGNRRVHLLTPDGIFDRFLITASDFLELPYAAQFNQDGDLLVVDRGGNIYKIIYREAA